MVYLANSNIPLCRVCCEKPPPYPARHLCRDCWKVYGGRTTKDRAPWVNRLINQHQSEWNYQVNGVGSLTTSLDRLVETGYLDYDSIVMVRSSSGRRKKRRNRESLSRDAHRVSYRL